MVDNCNALNHCNCSSSKRCSDPRDRTRDYSNNNTPENSMGGIIKKSIPVP